MNLIITIILALLLTPVAADCRMNVGVLGGGVSGVAAPDACTACPDATNGGDVLCEDFEGADYLCSWGAEAIEAGDAITVENHSGSLACTNKGSKAAQLVYAAATSDTYMLYDLGTGTDNLYVSAYINVVSESLGSGGYANAIFASTDDEGNTRAWNLFLYQDGANLKWAVEYWNGASYSSIIGTTVISTGTWYKVDVLWSYSTTTVQLWVDGTSVASASNTGNRTPRYIGPGTRDANITAATTLQMDIFKIDDDTRPSACPTS